MELQNFNIRLFSLSLSVATSLGVDVSGVDVHTEVGVEKRVLILQILARSSAWRPTVDHTGKLVHVTVEGMGLSVALVSANIDVGAAVSYSSIVASTVSVESARAQYRVDATRLPREVADSILKGMTLAGPVSFDALQGLTEAVTTKWPELIRKDPSSLKFREMQLHPPKPRSTRDKVLRAHQISEVVRDLAAGKTLSQECAKIQVLRKKYEEAHLVYDGPSETLAEAVYASFGAGEDDPNESGAADEARKWLHLYT